jgi:hypothetical protein
VTLKDKLINNLAQRQALLRADRNIYTMELQKLPPEELLEMSINQILKGAESKLSLVDVSVSLGHRIRQRLKLKRDTVAACHAGWFVIVAYLELDLITYYLKKTKKKGRTSKYRAYHISLKNPEAIREIWEELSKTYADVEFFPLDHPPEPWVEGIHALGYPMIRKADSYILADLNPEKDQFIMDTLNKLGNVPWSVNNEVLEVYNYYIKLNNPKPSPFRFHRETAEDKVRSLKIESETILMMANKFKNRPHYHLWSCDFR